MDYEFKERIAKQEFVVLKAILLDLQRNGTDMKRLYTLIDRANDFDKANPGNPSLYGMLRNYFLRAEKRIRKRLAAIEYEKAKNDPQIAWTKVNSGLDSKRKHRIPPGIRYPVVMRKDAAQVLVFNDWQWRMYFDQGYRL